jgi:hypothetical protein
MNMVCPHCGKEFQYKKPKKSYEIGSRDPISKIKAILSYLKTQDSWAWLRKIAKATKLKPFAVSYLVGKYLVPYLEILEPADVLESTGIKMKMVKLKNRDLDIDAVIKDINIRINS